MKNFIIALITLIFISLIFLIRGKRNKDKTMIDKRTAIETYKALLNRGPKEFTLSVFGSKKEPCDGWRTVTFNGVYLTLEKNPGAYLLYNKEVRFKLSELEGKELIDIWNK
jgi:hypothetical protein